MTCIVGVVEPDGMIYLGSDTLVSEGDGIRTLVDPKIFTRGNFIIGSAGNLRILQLIKYKMQIPPIKKRKPEKYMVTSFVDAMRKCLKKSGAAREENKEEEQDNCFIVGFNGRLFTIDSAYGVCESTDNYAAIGSGEEYALGSLYTTINEPVLDRVNKALESASHFSSSVGPPFRVLKMKPLPLLPKPPPEPSVA